MLLSTVKDKTYTSTNTDYRQEGRDLRLPPRHARRLHVRHVLPAAGQFQGHPRRRRHAEYQPGGTRHPGGRHDALGWHLPLQLRGRCGGERHLRVHAHRRGERHHHRLRRQADRRQRHRRGRQDLRPGIDRAADHDRQRHPAGRPDPGDPRQGRRFRRQQRNLRERKRRLLSQRHANHPRLRDLPGQRHPAPRRQRRGPGHGQRGPGRNRAVLPQRTAHDRPARRRGEPTRRTTRPR